MKSSMSSFVFQNEKSKWHVLKHGRSQKFSIGFEPYDELNIMDLVKNKSMRQYLIESIDSWVNKTEPLITDEFISEMCDFIKSENEVLYDRLMKKCALKGISVGEGIFECLKREFDFNIYCA